MPAFFCNNLHIVSGLTENLLSQMQFKKNIISPSKTIKKYSFHSNQLKPGAKLLNCFRNNQVKD